MPQKLQWTLSSYDAGTASWVEVFTKYVIDFDGEVGCSGSLPESDWQEYKRFYFRYWGHEIHGVPGPKAYVTCLTNCGDAAGYNGINNIEENCWQTDIKSDLSGPTNNTVLQLTSDGHYQVEVIAYAWDTTFQCTKTIDVELHNSSPIVSKAEILDESKAVVWDAFWHAEETLRGLEAELVINVNESVLQRSDSNYHQLVLYEQSRTLLRYLAWNHRGSCGRNIRCDQVMY